MDLSSLENADSAELRLYLEFLLWHYRVAVSFWFIFAAGQCGQETAEQVNVQVWEKAGALGAREIIKRFGITDKGLTGFVAVLRYYPWHLLIGYEIQERDGEVIITVPHCPTQEARLKRGLGEYSCREMHGREFAAFAKEIDEGIVVECFFAPPGDHPADTFCKWRFSVP